MTRTFRETALSYVEYGGQARYLDPIVSYFGDRLLTEIAPFDIRQMVMEVYKSQSNATRNRQGITPARAVMMHGYDRGWGPLIRVRRFPVQVKQRKETPSSAWMTLFLRQCIKDDLPHLAAIVLFMNQTGARVSEAVNLRWEQVDLLNREVLLLKTKTDTLSTRALTDELVTRIGSLSRKTPNVFKYTSRYSVNERIRSVCKRAGITYKNPHLVGRHSFATNAINRGVDTKRVMEAGGWKSVDIFLGTYVHVTDAARSVADKFNSVRYDVDL